MAKRTKTGALKNQKLDTRAESMAASDRVPEILIDGYRGAAVINGILRLNCFRIEPNAAGVASPAIIARLAMSLETFSSVVEAMKTLKAQLEQEGAVPGKSIGDKK